MMKQLTSIKQAQNSGVRGNTKVAKISQIIEDDSHFYVVYEYAKCPENYPMTMPMWIEKFGSHEIKEKNVKFIVRQIVMAIQFLKNQNIVVKNLKPSNILFLNDESLLI